MTFATTELNLPTYELGQKIATRKAFGDALAALGAARADVVALDGEVGNSTFTQTFAEAHPERFFQMYIAEQQMIGSGRRPAGARLQALRRHLRRVLQPCL